MTLNISSELEAKIRERVTANGHDLEKFVEEAVFEKLNAETQAKVGPRDSAEWRKKLQALIDLHPTVTHVVDDSRESIYAGRGE